MKTDETDLWICRTEKAERSFCQRTACQDGGIEHLSKHSRHSYRTRRDELGTPITGQQRASQHGDIRVTMSYGGTVDDAMREATSKVAAKAIPQ